MDILICVQHAPPGWRRKRIMMTDIDRVKKLVGKDLMVDAVELPPNHHRKPLIADDIEEALCRFDDDADYAHFIIRVRRTSQSLARQLAERAGQEPVAQTSIEAMVAETLQNAGLPTLPPGGAASTEGGVERDDSYDPETLAESARLLEENKDYALAKNIYQAMVRKGWKIPVALSGLARAMEHEGNNEEAVRLYQEAIAYSSELAFYQALAALQIRTGNDKDAAETLLRALGLSGLTDENKFDFHKSLGNCFTRLGDYAKAEHHYLQAFELNASSDVLQVNVGSLALQKGDYDAAHKHFRKAADLNPKSDKAVSGLGMTHLAQGDVARAHREFVASLDLNPSNLGAIYNLVKCSYELKKYDDAARLLQRYVEANPVNTNILYSYAGILYHQGEFRRAHDEVRKILEGNPSHAGAKELRDLIVERL